MVKNVLTKDNYQEIVPVYIRNGVQYYQLNLDPVEKDGMIICLSHIYNHYPTDDDKENLYTDYLNMCKRVKLAESDHYDHSEQVNGFYLGDVHAWLDKATRVGLANSIAIEKASGKTETTLYLSGIALTIGIKQAQQMLATLELYALDCYRKTEEHKIAINALTTIEEAENYDYTQGYPEQLKFEL